jgi:hypothetical protein
MTCEARQLRVSRDFNRMHNCSSAAFWSPVIARHSLLGSFQVQTLSDQFRLIPTNSDQKIKKIPHVSPLPLICGQNFPSFLSHAISAS